MPPTLLLTRPAEASRHFAASVADLALPVVISPVLRIVPVAHDRAAIEAARVLVFTSVHGVAAAPEGRGRRAVCVGPATARAARAAGYDVTEGPGDADRMMPLLAAADAGWLHLHGAHRARELPLAGMVVYDQLPLEPSPAALDLLSGPAPVIVAVFSPRSARLVSAWAQGARAPVLLAAISAAARDAWQADFDRVAVAPTPDAPGMRKALESLLTEEADRRRRVEAPPGDD